MRLINETAVNPMAKKYQAAIRSGKRSCSHITTAGPLFANKAMQRLRLRFGTGRGKLKETEIPINMNHPGEVISMTTTGLPNNQVQQYRRDGYGVLPGLLDAIALKTMDQRIDKITEDAFGSDDYSQILEVEPETAGGEVVVRRIYNPYDLHDDFKDLAGSVIPMHCITPHSSHPNLVRPTAPLVHFRVLGYPFLSYSTTAMWLGWPKPRIGPFESSQHSSRVSAVRRRTSRT